MPTKQLRSKLKLGDIFGGLAGRASKALQGKVAPGSNPNSKKKRKKRTRKEILDSL